MLIATITVTAIGTAGIIRSMVFMGTDTMDTMGMVATDVTNISIAGMRRELGRGLINAQS